MEVYSTVESFLDMFMELSLIVKSAISAGDIDIVDNALKDREQLINDFRSSGLRIEMKHKTLVDEIQKNELENAVALNELFELNRKKSDENKRQMQSLQNGIKVSDKYHSPYTDPGGSYIDKRR